MDSKKYIGMNVHQATIYHPWHSVGRTNRSAHFAPKQLVAELAINCFRSESVGRGLLECRPCAR